MTNIQTKVYILHHTPAVERKQQLLQDLTSIQLHYPIEWVEGFLPEDIAHYQSNIKIKELSLLLKHKFVLEQQILNNIQNVIVFEDDINLNSTFNVPVFLSKCIEELNNEQGDILWFGGIPQIGPHWEVPADTVQPNKICYFSEKYLSRCTHGYVLSLKATSNILQNYHYSLPVDHLYNEIIISKKIRSGWTAPFLNQKTAEGIWSSTLI